MIMKLYRYTQDFDRMGDLTGVFLADEKDLKWFMGTNVWESDILGKHSEVEISFDESTVKELPVSAETVVDLHRVLGKNISGVTPYDYVYQIDEIHAEGNDSNEL